MKFRKKPGGIYADLNQAIEAAHELRDSLLTHHQKESA